METSIETRNKVGLLLFWIAAIGAFLLAVVVSIVKSPAVHTLTLEELNQTIWPLSGPVNLLWGHVTPLLALVAGIGVVLYAGAKG